MGKPNIFLFVCFFFIYIMPHFNWLEGLGLCGTVWYFVCFSYKSSLCNIHIPHHCWVSLNCRFIEQWYSTVTAELASHNKVQWLRDRKKSGKKTREIQFAVWFQPDMGQSKHLEEGALIRWDQRRFVAQQTKCCVGWKTNIEHQHEKLNQGAASILPLGCFTSAEMEPFRGFPWKKPLKGANTLGWLAGSNAADKHSLSKGEWVWSLVQDITLYTQNWYLPK